MKPGAKYQRGFTLPELLIALLIFSTIAAASVYTLRLGVEARDQLSRSDDQIREIQLARKLIKEDFAQAIDRVVRDEFGQPFSAAFIGGTEFSLSQSAATEKPLVALVRQGWTNSNGEAPRSSLQYVQYLFVDNALVRRVRPYLDDARDQPRLDRVLISDVSSAEILFLQGETSGRLDWVAAWPLPRSQAVIPSAVSLTVNTKRHGELRQLFWLGVRGLE